MSEPTHQDALRTWSAATEDGSSLGAAEAAHARMRDLWETELTTYLTHPEARP